VVVKMGEGVGGKTKGGREKGKAQGAQKNEGPGKM